MSLKRVRISDSEPYQGLLGSPALLKSESMQDYMALRAALSAELCPQNIIGELRVDELTNKIWEERRFRRSQAALVDASSIDALAILLTRVYADNMAKAFNAARDYFSGNLDKANKAKEIIDGAGITLAQIDVSAMDLRMRSLSALDHMIAYRERSRNAIIKEHKKRQKKIAKRSNVPVVGDAERPRRIAAVVK